ncbi:hypothetical protein [Marinobacterium stanieri]|uniref:hypothetical protein n=1 Tax=Marinobacterium stanieri TaxID=49186 RepID=UPI003A9123A7
MRACYKSGDFQKYFKENMNALGLPVPSELFSSFNTAVANAALMVEALKTLGPNATMAELVRATSGLEKLKVTAALGASYYVGGVVGSISVATGRSLGCGQRLSDAFLFLSQYNLDTKVLRDTFISSPELLSGPKRLPPMMYSKVKLS